MPLRCTGPLSVLQLLNGCYKNKTYFEKYYYYDYSYIVIFKTWPRWYVLVVVWVFLFSNSEAVSHHQPPSDDIGPLPDLAPLFKEVGEQILSLQGMNLPLTEQLSLPIKPKVQILIAFLCVF